MELSIRGLALPTPGAVHKTHVSQLDYLISVGTEGPQGHFGTVPCFKLAAVSGIRGTSLLLCSVQSSHVDLELLSGMNLREHGASHW